MVRTIINVHYPIFLDSNLVSLVDFLEERKDLFERFFILVDENTHTSCVPYLLNQVGQLHHAEILEMDAGEENKNLNTASRLWEALIENKANRQTLIINLGGGMVTDMGGFVASVFKRGIPFIHIPTTLLGMTDAAIGSKTAIDFAGAKNQVGTFAHPMGVFISTQFLQSLSDRDLFSAFGEIIKYALTSSATLWDVIANQSIDRSMDFDFIIGECAEIKNNVVQKDWHESADRKILNFGHTAGHALESLSLSRKKRRLLHGEAIALGIIIELFISTKILGFPTDKQREIEQYILDNFDLYPIDSKDFDALVGWMRMDKKNSQNGISFVLLKEIGEPVINQLVHEELIMAALKYYAEL